MNVYLENGKYVFGDRLEGVVEASMSADIDNTSSYVETIKKRLDYSNSTNISLSGIVKFMFVKSNALMRIRLNDNNIYCKSILLQDVYENSINIKNIGRVVDEGKITSIASTANTLKDSKKNYKYSRLIAEKYDTTNPPSVETDTLYLTFGANSVYVSTNVPVDATGAQIRDAINLAISSTIFSSSVELQWKTDHLELVSLTTGKKTMNIIGNLANAIGFSDPVYKEGTITFTNSAKYHLRWQSGARKNLTSVINTANHHDITIKNTIGAVGDYFAIVNNSQCEIEAMIGYKI